MIELFLVVSFKVRLLMVNEPEHYTNEFNANLLLTNRPLQKHIGERLAESLELELYAGLAFVFPSKYATCKAIEVILIFPGHRFSDFRQRSSVGITEGIS